ncbi:MAG: methyltransferase domain-containing protein [Salinivirgaceae bacterium]|nr:methyltransferase domain-containing protein [Salinivirgaceae bacterium]
MINSRWDSLYLRNIIQAPLMKIRDYWNKIYAQKNDNEVSWYQSNPETSVALVQKYTNNKTGNIIDIGSGNSEFSKSLFALGYKSLSMLDISEEAIERSRAKLMKCRGIHDFYTTNILDFKTSSKYNIWHDRAVFHYLINADDILKYVSIASKAIEKNGYLIISTYSLSEPEKCNGLSVNRYSAKLLSEIFQKNFDLVESFEENHNTPMNTKQNFVWTVFRTK